MEISSRFFLDKNTEKDISMFYALTSIPDGLKENISYIFMNIFGKIM